MPYPTPEDYTFDEGIDPTATFSGPEATTLLTFERLALPNSYRGLTIYDDTTPTTSGEPSGYATDWYAWQKRCVWISPTTGEIAVYRTGLGWVSPTLGSDVVATVNIVDGAVTPAKIAPGTATYILRTNAAGTACEFASLSTILSAGSVPLSAISPTGASATLGFMRSNGTTNYWGALGAYDINLALGSGGLSITTLSAGTARYVLRMNAAGSTKEWITPLGLFDDYEITLAKLSPGTGNANKAAIVNAAGTAFEYRALPAAPTVSVATSTAAAVPGAGTTATYAHGLATIPTTFACNLVCVTPNNGYVAGDVIQWLQVEASVGANNEQQCFSLLASTTNLTLTASVGSEANWQFLHATTGATVLFVKAEWNIIFKATLLA